MAFDIKFLKCYLNSQVNICSECPEIMVDTVGDNWIRREDIIDRQRDDIGVRKDEMI